MQKNDPVVIQVSIEAIQRGFHYSGGKCYYIGDGCLLFIYVEVNATVVCIAI